ncbi:ester cyclase [Brucella endophytica]|uniref:ester cyclase n=1 Tax=Brucella endophytica TaxID=1963359 RepID=UPI003570C598
MKGFGAAFPDTKITIHEIIGADGRVAVRASISGTHLAEWFGVAATGKSFEMPIHEFHHGRLTHTWHLEDCMGWFFQVGAWPQAGKQEEKCVMKAIRISGYNASPVLEEVQKSVPAAGEVLVRVVPRRSPLNVKLQLGYMEQFFPLHFPYTLGTNLTGEIEEIGPDARGWAIGDKVVARTDPTAGGAFAEYAVVPSAYIAKAPATIPLEHAAGIATADGTAWQALFESIELAKDQSILIHAGAGGVGSFAIQFARHADARVFATASGEGVALARQVGADNVIDYRSSDFTQGVSDVDVVLDTIGGDTQQQSYKVSGGTV